MQPKFRKPIAFACTLISLTALVLVFSWTLYVERRAIFHCVEINEFSGLFLWVVLLPAGVLALASLLLGYYERISKVTMTTIIVVMAWPLYLDGFNPYGGSDCVNQIQADSD